MTTTSDTANTRKWPIRALQLVVLVGVVVVMQGLYGSGDEETASPASAAVAAVGSPDSPTGGHDYGQSVEAFLASADVDTSTSASGFEEIQWTDLVPPGLSRDEIWAKYEDRLYAAEPGSPETRAIYEEMDAEFDDEAINGDLDGDQIVLSGFVAPTNFDGELVTEFLLVPTFGACVHVPPPPVNQTIMVTLPEGQGMTITESWGAVWVAGTLTATTEVTDIGTAGYAVDGATFGIHQTV